MNDTDVAERLNRDFVCAFKQVSTFSVRGRNLVHHDGRVEKVQKNGGNIASYFCDPMGRVLHLAVGPVAPDRILLASKQAIKTWKSLPDADEEKQKQTFQNQMLKIFSAEELEDFRKETVRQGQRSPDKIENAVLASKIFQWETAAEHSRAEILEAKTSKTHVHRTSGFRTFNFQFLESIRSIEEKGSREDLIKMIPAVNKYCNIKLSPDVDVRALREANQSLFFENLFLSACPLTHISKMEKPVFEILVGQPYSTYGPAFNSKLEAFRDALAGTKPIVVILKDQPTRGGKSGYVATHLTVDRLQEYLPIKKRLDQFVVLPVTTNELFGILSESNLEPIGQKLENRKVKSEGAGYVLFDTQGRALKVLPVSTKKPILGDYIKWLIKQT